MVLFIFESIGTSELILIGVVALIFLGPRKMPEYARKIGKMMNEFKSTTNEFKATWEREVNFDEEVKALRIDDDEPGPVPRVASSSQGFPGLQPAAPVITDIDPATFIPDSPGNESPGPTEPADDINDKKNWF